MKISRQDKAIQSINYQGKWLASVGEDFLRDGETGRIAYFNTEAEAEAAITQNAENTKALYARSTA